MNRERPANPRVSLSKAQLQEGIGAELFSLCQGITADGELSKDEILALSRWLQRNSDADLAGVAFLSSTLKRIVADGKVTREEQADLLEAIEKVLPPDARKLAKSSRRIAEARRKTEERAVREARQAREAEREAKRTPEDEFDFMVAGVQFEERYLTIARHLNVGDRVRLRPEPDNKFDEFAVAVTLLDGRKIGYVPRTESENVAGCLDYGASCGGLYVATVKKVLTGRDYPVPVILLWFFERNQLADIRDLSPEPCPQTPPVYQRAQQTGSPRPWWKFW